MINSGRKLQYFPHCEFVLAQAEQVVALINQMRSERKPASLIRLGDAEGMLLARPRPKDTELWAYAVNYFGPQITTEQITALADALEHAIALADVVGVRDDLVNVDFPPNKFELQGADFLEYFKKSFNLRSVERDIPYSAALRLAHLHRFLATRGFRDETVICSAWWHFMASANGALAAMAAGSDRIGLISSKPALANKIRQRLRVELDFYEVPDKPSVSISKRSDHVHFPDAFDRTMETLKIRVPGQLFLVGAGICGKVYCNKIRDLGGIGLDIGAVCDSWINLPTRPLVLRSLFCNEGDCVPEQLLLEYQVSRLSLRQR